MTADAPPPPPGRRGNGLPATEWGALVDLDPRLSETLLERLAAAEVAAYVEPATAVDPSLRAVVLPDRPLDRLWVDPARAEAARVVVSAEVADLGDPAGGAEGLVRPVPRGAAGRVLPPPHLPAPHLPPATGPTPPSAGPADEAAPAPAVRPARPSSGAGRSAQQDDEAFAAIIAGWDDDGSGGPGGSPVPRWPVSEDLDPAEGRRPDRGRDTGSPRDVSQREGTQREGTQREGGQREGTQRDGTQRDGTQRDAPDQPLRRRRSDPPLTGDPTSAGPTRPGPADLPPGPPPAPTPGLPSWVEPEALDDDGHYVPPPPPPVPRLRPRTVLAVAAVLVGIVVLVAPGRLGLVADGATTLIGLLLLGGGAGALVAWVRDSAGPDDGAVV